MKLEWQRPGVVRMTAKVAEVASLVAAARMAATVMEQIPGEPAIELRRVLDDFERATRALTPSDEGVVR